MLHAKGVLGVRHDFWAVVERGESEDGGETESSQRPATRRQPHQGPERKWRVRKNLARVAGLVRTKQP